MFSYVPYVTFVAFSFISTDDTNAQKEPLSFGSVSGRGSPLHGKYGIGRCPVINTMPGFNMTGIYGKWYVVAEYSEPYPHQRCRTVTLSGDESDSGVSCRVTAKLEYIDTKSGKSVSDKPAYVFDSGSEGKPCYTIKYKDGPSRNFWIIATDYNNYLAVYSCTEFPDDNSLPLRFYEQHSWVVDRKPDGVKHLPESVKRGFEELGISMEPFVFMDRNCD